MTQARVVIRGAALEMGEHLLSVTRLASLTELINVMFSRYGKHLEVTWVVLPDESAAKCCSPESTSESAPEIASPTSAPKKNFKFDEPITGL